MPKALLTFAHQRFIRARPPIGMVHTLILHYFTSHPSITLNTGVGNVRPRVVPVRALIVVRLYNNGRQTARLPTCRMFNGLGY